MPEHRLNIKIIQAGRITGQYNFDGDDPILEKIVYPAEPLPFDVGIVPTTLTPFGYPLSALVLSPISHPVNTQLETRLLGGFRRASDEFPMLLTASTADAHAPETFEQLDVRKRDEIVFILKEFRPGDWSWLTVQECEPHLHAASQRHRQSKSKMNRPEVEPDWKPIWIHRLSSDFAETERYTPAEYTFHQLPYRFQHYVGEYLAPHERILYAVQRPAMLSHKKHLWRREQLQEGVLILTDQRLIHLAELIPPDSANIRYGFRASLGTLERFAGASLKITHDGSLLLHTEWLASGGKTAIEWEAPSFTHTALNELLCFLKAFQVDDPALCALRRASIPSAPDALPDLDDPASSDPDSLIPLNKDFSTALTESLFRGEQARAWALYPQWFTPKKLPQALVVTERRLFILPDLSLDIPLSQIATLEYTGSILESSITLNFFDNGKLQRKVLPFPYPAQDSFRDCFEAARRCMAVAPLV